eukprot:gene218-4464_t
MKRKFFNEEVGEKIKKYKLLKELTDDILYFIFQFINDFELNIIRFTNKRFLKISNYPNIWKTIDMGKICLYKNVLTKNLEEKRIISFFNSINTESIQKISLKNCRKMNIDSLVKVLENCTNVKSISLILCKISILELLKFFEVENFLNKLQRIELGIILIDPSDEISRLEELLEKKNIELDCALCRNCRDRILLKSLCCGICKKINCLNCNFTFFCSFCTVWICNDCAVNWENCDICGRISCGRCNCVKYCSICQKNACSSHCDCMFIE